MKILNCFILIYILLILGCSNANNPESVAIEYTKAYHQCDFTKAISLCSPKMKMKMEKETDFFTQLQQEKAVEKFNPRVSIIDSKIAKDGIRADVEVALENSAIIEIEEGKTCKLLIKLVKINDKWYIGTE